MIPPPPEASGRKVDEMAKTITTILLTDELIAATRLRGTRSEIVRRDLSRYYGLLARAKQELQPMFSVDELSLIAEALNGSLLTDERIGHDLLADVSDAVRLNGLAEKWNVNGPALIAKVRELRDDARGYALVDAVEIWWRRVGDGEGVTVEDILR